MKIASCHFSRSIESTCRSGLLLLLNHECNELEHLVIQEHQRRQKRR